MQRFVEIGDSHGAEIIQSSCVGCLSHLAVLCGFMSQLEPNSKPRLDAICDWSLEQLGDLTQGMNFDEYTYLDLLLRVSCWVDRSWESPDFLRLIRFRGKGRWSRSTHGSVTHRTR